MDALIKNTLDMKRVFSYLERASILAFDFETTGLDFISDEIVGLSLATDNGLNVYLPFKHDGITTLNPDIIFPMLKPYFEKDGLMLLAHNMKFDIQFLWNQNIDIGSKLDKGQAADTLVMSALTDENREYHNLKYLGRTILKIDMTEFKDLTQYKKLKFYQVPIEQAVSYALKDTTVPLALYKIFIQQLEKERLLDYLFKIEMPFLKVLALMERRGVYVDHELLDLYEERINTEVTDLHHRILVLAGREFNLNSGDQLGEVLFSKDNGFGAPIQGMTAGGKKPKKDGSFAPPKPTTDADAIEALSKIPNAPWTDFCLTLLRYKALAKIKSTYIMGIRKLLRADGKLHCSFNQTGTVTGRLSSSDPNLQNQPARETWVDIYFPGDSCADIELYSVELRKKSAKPLIIPDNFEEFKSWFPHHKVEKYEYVEGGNNSGYEKYIREKHPRYKSPFYVVKMKIRDFYYNPYGVLVVSD